MMNAYDKNYLEKARTMLGSMLDYAVNNLGYSIREFWDMFLVSNISKKFEIGDSSTMVGKSGIEVCLIITNKEILQKTIVSEEKSKEYWTGWALAYYQWKTGLSFRQIDKFVSIENIIRMYFPYHEMDIRQFCDRIDELINSRQTKTNLNIIRKSRGLTQNQIATITGIPLRTIQQYEQGQKNINCARSEYLICLAKALYCSPEELLEIDKNNNK